MLFAHDTMSVLSGHTRRLMSSSAPSSERALPITLLLTIGSLLLPKRPITG